jgi:hypothetical protein
VTEIIRDRPGVAPAPAEGYLVPVDPMEDLGCDSCE